MGLLELERRLLALVLDWLTRFLKAALDAVLAVVRQFGIQPNPADVFTASPIWSEGVDRIVGELEIVAGEARDREWRLIQGVADDIPGHVSGDTFVMSALATSRNLLVRIPDEVYQVVFAEITDGVNDGESVPELTARIERVLSVTGSERWPNRARVIAITEANRASNTGAFSAAMQAQNLEGEALLKEWVATNDNRVRPTHENADRQRVPLMQPFVVGNSLLMYPGDPAGMAEEVVGCRCSMTIHDSEN
jgi:hypothetical protein